MNEQLIGDLFVEAQRQMSGSSSREFSEKFAELIVEECAQRAEAYAYMSPNFTALAEELRRMKQNG